MVVTDHSVVDDLSGRRDTALGEGNVPYCIQCGTCSGVCPLTAYMDQPPRSIVASLLAGRDDELTRGRDIWVCTGCYACTVACPAQFPITETIYALKRLSMRTGSYPRRFTTPVIVNQFVSFVNSRGRSSEFWLSLSLYLRTQPSQLLRNAVLALRLLRLGRLRLWPESVRGRDQLRTILTALDEGAGHLPATGGADHGALV